MFDGMGGKLLPCTINLAAIACKQGERRKISSPETKIMQAPAKNVTLLEPGPAVQISKLAMPTTAETLEELKRRLGKELYRLELDLQGGGRIAGKPCDCLRAKHNLGIEATAEELMSYEHRPIYGEVIQWIQKRVPEFEPTEIAKHEPDYYRAMIPAVRDLRKQVMGTENIVALLNEDEKKKVMR